MPRNDPRITRKDAKIWLASLDLTGLSVAELETVCGLDLSEFEHSR